VALESLKKRALSIAGVLLLAAPAYAHGEQILAFPCSIVIVLAVAISVALAWPGRARIKVACCAALVVVTAAGWFAPWVPQTMSATAKLGFGPLVVLLLMPASLLGLGILLSALSRRT